MVTVTDGIESSRNKGICDFVIYLENPDSYEQVVESSLLSYPKKRELAKVVKRVFSRLFSRDLIDESRGTGTSEGQGGEGGQLFQMALSILYVQLLLPRL